MIYDVAVIGGGPAGSAVAAVLARLGRRVIVFERSRFETPRIGETFGGELQPLLHAIGAWDAFAALPQIAFRTVRAAWGTHELSERASITNPFGDGFHVPRAEFDALLARVATAAGASVRLGSGLTRIERSRQGFRVQPACGGAVFASFLIDASGRGAPASAALSGRGRWLACDRMVAMIGRVSSRQPGESALLIETSEDGWWYSAPQPGGTVVVVLMTDADLVPAGPRDTLTERWRAALARTRHTAALIGDAPLSGSVHFARAESGYLVPDRGPGYCAVGDAEMASDPLAGNGVVRALRSGLQAAEAVDRALSGGPLPESGTAERFADALDRRARYYLIEQRWPDAPFWVRRRPPDWATAPLTLPPTSLLRWDGRPPARDALAKAEALLPRRAIAATLDVLRTPKPAHAALHALRSLAPLGDRRLLIGLQLLVEHGPLECVAAV